MAAAIILALTVFISLAASWVAPRIIEWNLFRPYWFLRLRQYWTAIGSAFVHANLSHLLFNCLTFWFFAFPLERVIGSDYACLGASGAILAVLFASIVYFPRQSIMLLPIPLPIPAPIFAVGYLLYSFYAGRHPQGRINHEAHFNGALAGLAFVALTDLPAWQRALHAPW
jgi:membrane associated rhomboid family serine protease